MLPTAAQIRALTLRHIQGTAEDTLIDHLILAADATCAAWCLFPRTGDNQPSMDADEPGGTYTLFVDGPHPKNPRVLPLRLRPIVSVTSLTIDDSGDWSYTTAPVQNVDYIVDPTGFLRLKPLSGYSFSSAPRGNRVTCTAGVDVSTTYDAQLAIGLLVAEWWRSGFTPANVQSVTQGGQSQTNAIADVELPKPVRSILRHYRLHERETPY